MNKIKVLLLVLLTLVSGCSTTMTVDKKFMVKEDHKFVIDIKHQEVTPEKALSIMKNRINIQLKESKELGRIEEGSSHSIEIIFNKYYMRHGGVRFGVGILAGTDIIDILVVVRSAGGNEILSQFTVQS
jgi:hypothetical protein